MLKGCTLHKHVCTCMHTCMPTCIQTYMHACMHTWWHVYTYVYIYICTHAHGCLYVRAHACMYCMFCIDLFPHLCVCTHIKTHDTCMHICIMPMCASRSMYAYVFSDVFLQYRMLQLLRTSGMTWRSWRSNPQQSHTLGQVQTVGCRGQGGTACYT